MSITESNTIDFVGLDKLTGEINLAISDHLNWDDKMFHADLVKKKIDTYIEFVITGQVYETFPQRDDQQIYVQITHKYPIPSFALSFYQQLEKILSDENIRLRLKYLPDDLN